MRCFIVSNFYTCAFSFHPYTARKLLYSDDGYMNFNIDTRTRAEDKKKFLHTANGGELSEIAATYDIEYLLVLKEENISKQRMQFFRENFEIVFEDEVYVIYSVGHGPHPDT